MIRWPFVLTMVFGIFLLLPERTGAQGLVTSISSDIVSIESNFTGTEIVIFGQVVRNARTVDRRGKYDLAIIVEGPKQNITTRRKGRFLGVWVNREHEVFQDVPSFYAISTTRHVTEMGDRPLLVEHEIGLNHLHLAVTGGSRLPLSERDDFRHAFIRLRVAQGLYSERSDSIEFLTDTMFRTTVPLPADIPVGMYTVKSFLLQDGALLSKTEEKLAVAKTGFEQFTFDMARNHAAIYGIVAVLLAMFTGWLAGVIFRKD
ncbi:TIGR02186 family protein [Roseibium sp. RKSG952]|uniref:TIGR02186 family protein n=1 Tax=Roseibium sp. RKSG952 TaxID=2529384 RepID=UPI0012BBD82F|nr:TIGR02186 family protein [Roseibium sp. RKSG952]MTI00230.1 hypothetical protein [Roseibium sp. RKSG952]